MSPEEQELVEAFDQAAQTWGWEADQGTRDVESAKAAYEIAKAAVVAAIERLVRERDEARKLVYVPGVLKCAKCGFRLIKTTLHVLADSYSADSSPDYCPNDGAPMWRVTERDAGNELCGRLDAAEDLAQAAEARVKALEKVLKMARGWAVTCSESATARKHIREIDALIAQAQESEALHKSRRSFPRRLFVKR